DGSKLGDAAAPRLVGALWTPRTDAAHMRQPGYFALGRTGTLWVADTGNDRVLAFTRDAAGAFTAAPAPPAGDFTRPYGIGDDPDGNLYVVDSGGSRIRRYDAARAHQADLQPTGADALSDPRGLVVV